MVQERKRFKKCFIVLTAALSITFLPLFLILPLSFDGYDVHSQMQQNTIQNAMQVKADFEKELAYARTIGVPELLLQPIVQQWQALQQTHAPCALS